MLKTLVELIKGHYLFIIGLLIWIFVADRIMSTLSKEHIANTKIIERKHYDKGYKEGYRSAKEDFEANLKKQEDSALVASGLWDIE